MMVLNKQVSSTSSAREFKVSSEVVRHAYEPHGGMWLTFFLLFKKKDVLTQSDNGRTILFVRGLSVMTAAGLMFHWTSHFRQLCAQLIYFCPGKPLSVAQLGRKDPAGSYVNFQLALYLLASLH